MTKTRKKILLVDDSNTVLLMHRMMLSGGSYELLIARNGVEAVDLALRERPDLIFMDVMMPQMDGLQACKQIRANPDMKSTPIIMVTTRGEPHNVQAGYESGCTEYITKPFDKSELMKKLRNHLGE
ncbi:response regulator [Vitiosangium sp. GDMCC 1.1324]|uniref:response regulator n=1 Tax=Vitiosangium sp. (strain GDMCC 1.1324) TaxID=2138576 RepID=UPI000D3D7E74|nr:response regulator [Vitiosangium sp. GDMCC 1.1324]PTL76427.1 response regulator [Vitiosangium sp. GDMCC 1.1324]